MVNPFGALNPSKNDATLVSSVSDDNDVGSEDGTEDAATQLIAQLIAHLQLAQ